MSYTISTDLNEKEKAEIRAKIENGLNICKAVSKLIRENILKKGRKS